MPLFKVKRPVAPNVTADAKDVIGTKMVLNSLGYYGRPSNGSLGGWVNTGMFDAIRDFQRDNGLDVDGVIRPGGATEKEVNRHLEAASETTSETGGKGPVITPPNVDPRMPIINKPFLPSPFGPPFVDENGHPILEGQDPKTGRWVRPPTRT